MSPGQPRSVARASGPHEVRPSTSAGGWLVWRPRRSGLIDGFAVFWGTEAECDAVRVALDAIHGHPGQETRQTEPPE